MDASEALKPVCALDEQPILHPLRLRTTSECNKAADVPSSLTCLFCELTIDISNDDYQLYLSHLLGQHKFVIGNFNTISDFPKYIEYWRHRFQTGNLIDYCAVIQTNSRPTDRDFCEFYYFLCDDLDEDKELRLRLQTEKLCEVLDQQQREREDTELKQNCLFCKQCFIGDRSAVFHHLSSEHNFSVGHPDNLVYVSQLLRLLEDKMEKLLCLFCEKTFTDRHTLKEHMRKKQHKKINPKHKKYDKFYVVNYLEFGKSWEQIQSENESEPELSRIDESRNWVELSASGTDANTESVCLYCSFCSEPDQVFYHMKETHNFDFHEVSKAEGLTFYKQVKVVNYIRRQVHLHTCPVCSTRYSCTEALTEHLTLTDHQAKLPDAQLWNQHQYMFSTYENDNLLCYLEADNDIDKYGSDDNSLHPQHHHHQHNSSVGDSSSITDASLLSTSAASPVATGDDEYIVIPEDLPTLTSSSILTDSSVRQQLTS